jgi:hypothetical protein
VLPVRLEATVALFAALALSCTSREEKAVEVVESIADAFAQSGDGDCDKLADRLDKIVERDKDALAALSESDASKEARKRSAKFQKRIDVAFGTILEKAPKCGAEPRVAKVLEKIL